MKDVAEFFIQNADALNSILLETAGNTSIAVLSSAGKLTRREGITTFTPLTAKGHAVTDFLAEKFAVSRETLPMVFPQSDGGDIITALQNEGHFLAGTFHFSYSEDLPDFEFFLAEEHLRIEGDISADIAEPGPATATASKTDAEFARDVEKLQQHIADGEIRQVVPSRTFTVECPEPYQAYQRIRHNNPSPYMFFVRGEDYTLLGSSPESSLKFDAVTRDITINPIAGTRPRGQTGEEDTRFERELRTDPKEISEHTMLIDVATQDLEKIADNVHVTNLMNVERYSRVMHLVSNVTGTLHNSLSAADAYRACMNMGTVSGAPKKRATQLLAEIEQTPRGSFGGAVGYFAPDGSFDSCIVIRSAYVRNGIASVSAGAGVVKESEPQAEADETFFKARAVLEAIADVEVVR